MNLKSEFNFNLLSKAKFLINQSRFAWVTLGVSLLLTSIAWFFCHQYIEHRANERFELRTMHVRQLVEARMSKYEQLLRSFVGLVVSSSHVTREDWQSYINNCELEEHFEGVQGVGYSQVIMHDQLQDHIDEVRHDGFPDYQITPPGDRERYTSIVYLEPFDWRNQRAFGFDMYSEPVRQAAMDRAIDTGLPSLSGMVILKQETESDVQRGFLCYLPVFNKGPKPTNIEARRARIQGFVFAPFRVNDLMNGIFDEVPDDVSFAIYDSNEVDTDRMLYNSVKNPQSSLINSPKFSSRVPISIRGETWTFAFETKPNFFAAEGVTSVLVALGGLIFNVLLFLIIAMVGRQKRQAHELANEIKKGLRETEHLNRSILESASEAIIAINRSGTITIFNDAAEATFGRKCADVVGQKIDQLLKIENIHFLLSRVDAIKKRSSREMLLKGIHTDESTFPCSVSIGRVASESGDLYIIIARNQTERIESEKKLAAVNQQLLDASRKSGMAEVATGVLHNVGNVLNSLNVSMHVLDEKLDRRLIERLRKATSLLSKNTNNVEAFFSAGGQGQHLSVYLEKLAGVLDKDHQTLEGEVAQLKKHIKHINEIVRHQQNSATVNSPCRLEKAEELLEDAAHINEHRNHENEIIIEKDFASCPRFETDRHKVLQILVNLIKNAQDALLKIEGRKRKIQLRTKVVDDQFIDLIVEDNGIGIEKDVIDCVLQFGYTTKLDGHGFGLHSSLNAATQLGADLRVESDGINKGARFILRIPIKRGAQTNRKSERPNMMVAALPQNPLVRPLLSF